jgi:hypothetical protein
MTRFTINVLRIDNIVVNSSTTTIVTMIDSHLILVLVINSRFVHLKYASYVINLHVNQRIISKKNARNRKSVLSIVTRHTEHVQNLSVVLSNLLSITKTMKQTNSSLNMSKNWLSMMFHKRKLRMMNSSSKSTTNLKHFSFSSNQ